MWAVPCRALRLGDQRCYCSALGEALAFEFEIEVAEVVYGVAVGIEEGGVEVADGGVAGLSVAGHAQVLAGDFQAAAGAADGEERPLVEGAVVGFAGVAEIDDDGVVEHGAVALGDGLEFRGECGDEFDVVGADEIAALVGGLAVRAGAVADGVDVLFAKAEAGVDVFEVVHADGDAVAEAGDQARGGECEVGFEAVHAVFGSELVGQFGGAVADDVSHRGEFFASLLEFFESDEVVVEFGLFCGGDLLAQAPDVRGEEVEHAGF